MLPPQPAIDETGPTGRGPIITAPPAVDDAHVDYDSTSLAGASVLVVDDDVRNVFALTSALEMHGAEVTYADNGTDGIRLLQERPEINLVLMDVMMPDMDGNETTAAIRMLPGRHDLPVLFLTAKAMSGDREKSFAAGASDYIAKPFDPWVLRAKVEVFVELHRARRRLSARTSELERRLTSLGREKFDETLGRVERLLVMAGDQASAGGPLEEALEEVRTLRSE